MKLLIISNIKMDKLFKEKLKKAGVNLNKKLFEYLLIFYLILLLIQEFKPKIIPLNMNYMLVLVIILGVITVLTYTPRKKQQKTTKYDYYLIYALGAIGTALIFIKIKELGWLAYLISIIAGILIILLSKLVLEENEEGI